MVTNVWNESEPVAETIDINKVPKLTSNGVKQFKLDFRERCQAREWDADANSKEIANLGLRRPILKVNAVTITTATYQVNLVTAPVHVLTAGMHTTLSIIGAVSGKACRVKLVIIPNGYTVTLPTLLGSGGARPVINGTTIIEALSLNGTTWYCLSCQNQFA
jgi:hypothetical protein